VDFYESDYSWKLRINFNSTIAGITHVSVSICGNDVRALPSCNMDNKSWLDLVLAKSDRSFKIICNAGSPVVYGEDCVRKIGNDITFIVINSAWEDGSVLYLLPHHRGKQTHTQVVIVSVMTYSCN
jgi:hypothetical protein